MFPSPSAKLLQKYFSVVQIIWLDLIKYFSSEKMKVILWETDKIAKVKCVWIVQIFESQQYLFLNKNSYLQEKELAQLWGLPSLRQWPVLKSQKLPQKAFWQILHRLCCSFTFTSCSVSSENIAKLLRQTLTLIFFTQLFYHWQEIFDCLTVENYLTDSRVSVSHGWSPSTDNKHRLQQPAPVQYNIVRCWSTISRDSSS